MKGLIFGIAGLLLLGSSGICQVDTLQLVEIGSIEAPAEITDLYVEDLDGDSLKEIILTTATNIHIYNGITYEEIWTSPDLVNPEDLLFEDINNDGIRDVSVKESERITVFDGLGGQTLWTSPTSDYPIYTYAIGERNGDANLDISIVTKQSIQSWCESNTYDTVRVHVYDGPHFTEGGRIVLPLYYYYCYEPGNHLVSHSESPALLLIQDLPSAGGLDTLFLLHINVSDTYTIHDIYEGYSTGSLLQYDSESLGYVGQITLGSLYNYESHNIGGDIVCYLFSSYHEYSVFPPDPPERVDIQYLSIISSDTVVNFTLPEATEQDDDIFYSIGDATPNHDGNEYTYFARDTLFLYNLPENILNWSSGVAGLAAPRFVYNSVSLYDHPQIAASNMFLDGGDGNISGVFPDGLPNSYAIDVDSDSNDEMFYVNANTLKMHHAEVDTEGIDPNFITHIIEEHVHTGVNAIAVDFDLDNDIDIVNPAILTGKILILENDGSQNFSRRTLVEDEDYLVSAFVVDVEADGDYDILTAGSLMGRISLWQDIGNQSYVQHILAEGFEGASWITAIDFDDDQDIDVIASAMAGNEIAWWENDGFQNFSRHVIADNYGGAFMVLAEDLDCDGDYDILASGFAANEIAWWENNGVQEFTKHSISEDSYGSYGIYAIDLDGDGDEDVISTASLAATVSWWENDGHENFIENIISTTLDGPRSIHAFDVDFDGDIDIQCAAYESSKFVWWENRGDGNFVQHVLAKYQYAQGAKFIGSADVDSDGYLDVFGTAGRSAMILWWEYRRTTEINGNDINEIIPQRFYLEPNYPNPFNSSTTIEYGLPQAGHVTIEIYDLLGRKVEMLVDEEEEAGTYQVVWDARDRSSGVYFYRITAGEFAETKRMVLLK